MTLKEIKELALINAFMLFSEYAHREHDSINPVQYINEGYRDCVLNKYRPIKKAEIIVPDSGALVLSGIDASLYEVVGIEDGRNNKVDFTVENGELKASKGEYVISYIVMPAPLANDEDIPIIPENFHYILADYCTYRMMLIGSKSRQARADVFYRSFYAGYIRLGELNKSKKLKNKYR